jgi:hypothetical protein
MSRTDHDQFPERTPNFHVELVRFPPVHRPDPVAGPRIAHGFVEELYSEHIEAIGAEVAERAFRSGRVVRP